MDAYLKYYEKSTPNASTENSENVFNSNEKINTPPLSDNPNENGGKRYITRNDLYVDPLLFYYEAKDVIEAPIGHDWMLFTKEEEEDSDDSEDYQPSISTAYKNRPGYLHVSPGIIIAEYIPPEYANINLGARKMRKDSMIYKWEFFYTNFLLYLLEFVKCHRQYMLVIQGLSLQEKKYVEYVITCLGNEEYLYILDFENCWQVNILLYIRTFNCYALRIHYGSESSNALLSIIKTAHVGTYVVLPENLNKKDKDLISRNPPPKIPLPHQRLLFRPYEMNPLLNPALFYNVIADLNCRNLRFLRLKLMEHYIINANIVKCCLLNLNLINLSIIDVTIEVLKDAPFVPNILVPLLIVPAKKVPFNPILVTGKHNEPKNTSLSADAQSPVSLNPNAKTFVSKITETKQPLTTNATTNLTKAASEPYITGHINAPRFISNNVPNLYSPNGQRPEFNTNMRPENPNLMRHPSAPHLVRCYLNRSCPVHFNMRPQAHCPNVIRPQLMGFDANPHMYPIHRNAYFPHPHMPVTRTPYPHMGVPPPMTYPTGNFYNPSVNYGMIPPRPSYYSTMNPNFNSYSMMPTGYPPVPPNPFPPMNRPMDANYQFNSVMPPTRPLNPSYPSDSVFPPVHTTPMNQPNPMSPTTCPFNPTYPCNSISASNTTVRPPLWPPSTANMSYSKHPPNVITTPTTTNQSTKSQQSNLTIPFTISDFNGNVLNRSPTGGIKPVNIPMAEIPVDADTIISILVNPDVLSFLTVNSKIMNPLSSNSGTIGLTVVKSDISPPEKESSPLVTPDVLTPVSIDLISPPTTLSSIISPSTTDTNDFSPAISEGASVSPVTKSVSLTHRRSRDMKEFSNVKTENQGNLTKKEGRMAIDISTLAEKESISTTGRAKKKSFSDEKNFNMKVEDPHVVSSAITETHHVSTISSLHAKVDMKADDANVILKEKTSETLEFDNPVLKEDTTVMKEEKAALKASNDEASTANETNTVSKDLVSDPKEPSSTVSNGKGQGVPRPDPKRLGLKADRQPRWSSIINVSFHENYFKGKRKKFGTKYNDKVVSIVQSFLRFATDDTYKEFMFLGPFEAKESEAICIFISLYIKNNIPYGDMYKDLEFVLNCYMREAKEYYYTIIDRVGLNYVIQKHKCD